MIVHFGACLYDNPDNYKEDGEESFEIGMVC